MNDSLYNPDTMSKEEIKALFVARQPLLDELITIIKNQPKGAGVQHLLIIAPRGMGKTTMLLMLQFAVEDKKELSKDWQAVRFPEESYDITELADFWLKTLNYLDDDNLTSQIEEIERKFTKSDDLREAAWALIKDWSKKHKKRIVLLVDNFDMILDQIGNDTEQARLRDILMNDGTVMLMGCAPSYFHQIQDYEQPLYNFFRTFNLNDLKFPDIEELLRRRAELDEILNIDEILKRNKTRIKALETFTGGNPRLVLMLYRIITSSDMLEVRKGLEQLLDAVTPYYKDKTEKLPPQQRKIINEIAQYSLEKNEGISPTEIAKKIRMTPNQVSSQLKRLSENGYVRALNIRGRSSFYVLSEPLYAIWAQMRFGRNAREKRNWLVQILKALYDLQEIQKEIEKLDKRVKRLKVDGRESKARGVLEYMLCLLETNPSLMTQNFELAVEGYLELKEILSLKTELTPERLGLLSSKLLVELENQKLINSETKIVVSREWFEKIFEYFFEYLKLIDEDIDLGNIDESLESLHGFISILEKHYMQSEGIALLLITAYSYKFKVLIIQENYSDGIIILDKIESICDGYDKSYKTYEFKLKTYLQKLAILVFTNKFDESVDLLIKYMKLLREVDLEKSTERITSELVEISKFINLRNIRKLMQKSNYENEFFPLIRAIDYIETKDESILEKLSPEIRIVVEETIKTLQMVSEENEVAK